MASYPFRDFIAGPGEPISDKKMDLKDFAAHVSAKFDVHRIEPWSRHFHSLETEYLQQFRVSVANAKTTFANIAVDGDQSPYALDPKIREAALAYGKKWVHVAHMLGSPSIRLHIPAAADSKPDVGRAAETLAQIADYAASKGVVVNLENDDPISEDPFFVAHVIEKATTPWLRALPDFANSLAISTEEYAYRGFDALASHAYNISHVKEVEDGEKGQIYRVDLDKAFGILKKNNYRGYLSMEWDSSGDPYQGTKSLIEKTLAHLA